MKQIKYLSREQQKAFLKAIQRAKNTRDLTFFTLLLRYGLRTCGARLMRHDHLRLDENSIFIQRAKGSVSQYYPLREDDKKLIERWLKERDKMENSDSPFLFISSKSGHEPLSRQLPQKLFEKYAEIAGIEGHSPHSLRHSTAVNLLDQGVDLFDIKTWLGHSSINSTMLYLKIGTLKNRKRMRYILESL